MLTKYQRETLDKMFKAVENKACCILDGSDRCTGKTYLLNELGYELQAVGYDVILLAKRIQPIKFYACKSVNIAEKIEGYDKRTTVVIIDGWEYSNRDLRELESWGYITVGFDIKYVDVIGYIDTEIIRNRLERLREGRD